jgi:S1-C subfamily serine protease
LLLWFLALTLFFASLAHGGDPYDPYRAVVDIKMPQHQGSGVMIAKNKKQALILSCRHVCNRVGARTVLRWRWAGGQVTEGYVLYVHPGDDFHNDLALVVGGVPRGVDPVEVELVDSADGPWVGAGFRQEQMRLFTADRFAVKSGRIHTFQGAAVSGMSGGPLFNRRGAVVGVVVASDRKSETISCDGAVLIKLVEQFRRQQ